MTNRITTRVHVRRINGLAAALLLAWPLSLHAHAQCEPQWLPTFGAHPGVAHGVVHHELFGMVDSLAVFDDGSAPANGPALYVGGTFKAAHGMPANHIAKWDGEKWSDVGGGVTGQPGILGAVSVFDMIVFDDGSGPALYVTGSFSHAGGVLVNRIAKWDGKEWSALGSGLTGELSLQVGYSLAVFDDGQGGGPALYVGGSFTYAGGLLVDNLAKWDGTSWSGVGGGVLDGLPPMVKAMRVWHDDPGNPESGEALYIGGAFGLAGGVPVKNIAKWDGVSFHPLGGGVWGASGFNDGWVEAFEVFDDALFVGGNFFWAGDGLIVRGITRWDGEVYSDLDGGLVQSFQTARALAVYDAPGTGPALHVGGAFVLAGGWDGIEVKGIARWDGSSWAALGPGMGSPSIVRALALYDDQNGETALFAGGWFTQVGDVEVMHVARWKGEEWSAVHERARVVSDVRDMLVHNTPGSDEEPALYMGARLIAPDEGEPGYGVVKWTGDHWSLVGGPIGNWVNAIASHDDDPVTPAPGNGPAIYAAGSFNVAKGGVADRIARWDGETWSPLGSGLSHEAYAMAVFDDGKGDGPALYVGGEFTVAGGVPAWRIAKWDGTSWSQVGAGFSNPNGLTVVESLAVFDDGSGGGEALYAGGSFKQSGSTEVLTIARWDGSSWSPVGGGLTLAGPSQGQMLTVSHMQVLDLGDGPALYVAGRFSHAGGVPVNNIAKWDGTTWSALGGGLPGPTTSTSVAALALYDDGTAPGGSGRGTALYAIGHQFVLDGAPPDKFARWDGSTWSPLGLEMPLGGVLTMTVFDDSSATADIDTGPALFIGGSFLTSPTFDSGVVKWGGCAGPPPPTPGDLTGTGSVGVPDLLLLLAAWGDCADCDDCSADLTGSCSVGVPDLLILLANWG